MSQKVTIVVGNPRPASRTRVVAETLVARLLDPDAYDLEVVELSDHATELFTWPSEAVAAVSERVAQSDLVVFATPTYKATYTGLLKAFLDRYPGDGLEGVVAIPVHTGGDLAHSMGPTFTLAPLLAELGAIVPGRGLYFPIPDWDDLDDIIGAAADRYAANLARVARVATLTRTR